MTLEYGSVRKRKRLSWNDIGVRKGRKRNGKHERDDNGTTVGTLSGQESCEAADKHLDDCGSSHEEAVEGKGQEAVEGKRTREGRNSLIPSQETTSSICRSTSLSVWATIQLICLQPNICPHLSVWTGNSFRYFHHAFQRPNPEAGCQHRDLRSVEGWVENCVANTPGRSRNYRPLKSNSVESFTTGPCDSSLIQQKQHPDSVFSRFCTRHNSG